MQLKIPKSPFFRFLVVGGASTVLNYTVYFILFSIFGMKYPIAFSIGFMSGVVFGYVLNKQWSFGLREASTPLVVLKYVLVYVLSLGLGLAVIRILVVNGGLDPLLANFFTILVTTCTNFVGARYLVFKA